MAYKSRVQCGAELQCRQYLAALIVKVRDGKYFPHIDQLKAEALTRYEVSDGFVTKFIMLYVNSGQVKLDAHGYLDTPLSPARLESKKAKKAVKKK